MLKQDVFPTVHNEGSLFRAELLQQIAQRDATIDGLTLEAYHLLKTDQFNEEISYTWNRLLKAWHTFNTTRYEHPERHAAQTKEWLLFLFQELGYGRLLPTESVQVTGKTYAISHCWQHAPIHLISYNVKLEQVTRATAESSRSSAYSLVQELLNRSEHHLWGMVSNGLLLRLLRRNVSLTRQAYIEFDLEAMLNGEVYADFMLFWLLCHQSRLEAERPEECWLEKWSRLAQEQGIRILDQLRNGVEQAIAAFGSGFLSYKGNHILHEKLRSGNLSTQDYYRQILRLVYRLIVMFVAEDRNVLFHPDADEAAQERYTTYYSTARLRRLAERRVGTHHCDLFQGLRLVMDILGSDEGCPALGLPALNGFLFSQKAIPDLVGCEIANQYVLDAIRALAFTRDGRVQLPVDYKNLGSEELGSVYESLLELHPVLNIEAATFHLDTASGNERKTTGSYYTPTSLINCLLDSALDPVLDEACAKAEPEEAILNLKICDPACGSGHFLIAAAHRVAKRLAVMRSGDEEPAPAMRRKALRDVVGRCLYGVDINPMSVELCKVSLWMEAIDPGKPLSFLDAHILEGNSLLGATPALLAKGIPDSAFEPIEGDDKKLCSEYKKLNKKYRAGNRTLFDPEGQPWDHLGNLATSMMKLDDINDETVEGYHRKQEFYRRVVESGDYLSGCLLADAWCAAFVWKKNDEFPYPITDEVFWKIEKNPYDIRDWMKDEIIRLQKQYKFFHWHLAFPGVFRTPVNGEESENEQAGWCGGFDVVLSNPPWERIKLQEKEWFASRRPDIAKAANAAQRRRMISNLMYEDHATYIAFMEDQRQATGESHLVRDSGRYPLCGRGDVNTYTIFAETMRLIINSRGRVGCIVPSGIATDDTTKYFFRDLMESHTLVNLYSFENEEFIFPAVHHATKFCLLTISGHERIQQSADFVFFARQTSYLQEAERHFSLSANDIALLNPNTRTCPIFHSKRDVELTKAIYSRVPVLIKEGPPEENPWSIKFSTMFHMTNDSHLFRSREHLDSEDWTLRGNVFSKNGEVYLPLYEAKMIWHFNHRFGTYEGATPEELARGKLPEIDTDQLSNPDCYPLPEHWVPFIEVKKACSIDLQWFLCFRGITSANLLRTFVGTIIPRTAAGNSLPLMLSSRASAIEMLCLQANLSSFIEDYVMRQSIGGNNLNLYIIKQIPFLPPVHYSEHCPWFYQDPLAHWIYKRAFELTYTAWGLEPFAKDCGYDGPPFRWDEERRFLLRSELDAAYFHLYGIERDDVDYIMETFPIVKRKDEKWYGGYRTKRVILEIYDEMKRAMETGEPYRTRLEPVPADPAVAHPPRSTAMFRNFEPFRNIGER